jgi:hypothetical protein
MVSLHQKPTDYVNHYRFAENCHYLIKLISEKYIFFWKSNLSML